MSRSGPSGEFRPEDSPPAWFVELLMAFDRGDFARAAVCQRRLAWLGWQVDRCKPVRGSERLGAAS